MGIHKCCYPTWFVQFKCFIFIAIIAILKFNWFEFICVCFTSCLKVADAMRCVAMRHRAAFCVVFAAPCKTPHSNAPQRNASHPVWTNLYARLTLRCRSVFTAARWHMRRESPSHVYARRHSYLQHFWTTLCVHSLLSVCLSLRLLAG